jgi:hypothetical protein
MLIGSPIQHPCCGRCFKTEILPTIKWATGKHFRVGQTWLAFYDYVGGNDALLDRDRDDD